jgi:tryptophan synthase alpha chain
MTDIGERGTLELALRRARDSGRKLLVPYVTGGLGEDWLDVVRAVAAAGADAIEIGIPFSDPVMDGPVIQEASVRALAGGATPQSIITALSKVEVDVPLAVMTYVNIVARTGYRRMAQRLAQAGIAGAILPDLPFDEAAEWAEEARAAGVENVALVAPTTPDDRLERICSSSRGFVYAVGLLGVTGERTAIASSALVIAERCRAVTDTPVLVGVGVSTVDQAQGICAVADGVVVGSALIRRLLDGGGPEAARSFIGEIRKGLDDLAAD